VAGSLAFLNELGNCIRHVRGKKTALGKVVAAVGTCKSLLKHTIVFMTAGVADSFRAV